MKVFMMVLLAFGMLVAFGCVTPESQPVAKEDLGEETGDALAVPAAGLISVRGDENLSVVKIMASMEGVRWQFPIQDHEDEFIRVGLHSDSFIKLNSSQVMFLEDEEAIWLHPMIQSGNRTVLFDAIYSREIKDCGAETVEVLGKEYRVQQLKNGSSFGSDDKWKVGLEKENGCTERLVIYLDGYFYDIGEGEQINLFRNDNTVIFEFKDIQGEPYVRVIGTRPAVGPLESEGGIELDFSHPVPKTWFGCLHDGLLVEDGERIKTGVNGVEWIVTKLTNDTLEIGIEEQYKMLLEGDNMSSIRTADKGWYVRTHECLGEYCDQIYTNLNDEKDEMKIHSGQTKSIDGRYLHVWDSVTTGPFGYQSTVSVLSETISIDSSEADFVWEDGDLSSVYVPKDSPSFEKLTGQLSK